MSVQSPNSIDSVSLSSTYAYSADTGINEKVINYLFDVSSAKNAKVLDTDLQSAILMVQNTDLSAQMQALIVDVMRLMATIRQQNMNNMQEESNLAFQTSKLTAEAQKSQAKSHATTEYLNASASAVQGASDLATHGVGALTASSKMDAIKKEADGMDFSNINPDGSRVNPASATTTNAPPAYNDVVKVRPDDELSPAELKRAEAGIDNPDGTPANAVQESLNDSPQAKASKAMWQTNQARNYFQHQDMKIHTANAIVQLGTSILKMAGASETANAGEKQAEATVYQALEHYLNARQQSTSAYASDMREAVSKVLQLIREAESARHASASQIANI